MFVDLTQKIPQFVVQEYLNKIVNAQTSQEIAFDTHKLIHTFDVVKMAQELIDETDDVLDEKTKKQILNGAVLHDIARCYEYKDGKRLKGFDHGVAGALMIHNQFPDLIVEQKTTELHNKLPAASDPQNIDVALGYIRDSDMLGNIRYQVYHMDLFLDHIRYPKETDSSVISDRIIQSVQQKIIIPGKFFYFLDMLLNELTWIFILKTKAALKLAKEQSLFVKYRDVIIQDVLPILNLSDIEKQNLKQKILTLFPNSLFEEVFQKHGV